MKLFFPFANQLVSFCAWLALIALLTAVLASAPAEAHDQDQVQVQAQIPIHLIEQTLEAVRRLQWVAQNDNAAPDPVAEIGALYCPDPRDWAIKLPIQADRSLKPIAEAKRTQEQKLVILFNPERMQKYHPATGLFWLMHECMHHVAGDTVREQDTANRASIEQAADCHAIKVLVQGGAPLLSGRQFAILSDEVAQLNGGTYYKAGPARAADIVSCAAAELSGCAAKTGAEQQACVVGWLP